jgi:hypothetical protein
MSHNPMGLHGLLHKKLCLLPLCSGWYLATLIVLKVKVKLSLCVTNLALRHEGMDV